MNVRDTLISANGTLDDRHQQAIIAMGPAAVEDLIDVFNDASLAEADAPGGGWAPVLAAKLLGELRDPRAIGPLLREFIEGDYGTELFDAAALALPKHGALALRPLLDAYALMRDREARCHLANLMAELGVRDERIWDALCESLPYWKDMISGAIGTYGDPRGVPLLLDAFDALPAPEGLAADEVFRAMKDMRYAVEQLGGDLGEARARKLDDAKQAFLTYRKEQEALEAEALGLRDTALDAPTKAALQAVFGTEGPRPRAWGARGFVAAVASSPSLQMPSQWLPTLLPARAHRAGTDKALRAVFGLLNATVDALDAGRGSALCPPPADLAAVAEFCEGYLAAAALDPAWLRNTTTADDMVDLLALSKGPEGGDVEALRVLSTGLDIRLDAIYRDLADARLDNAHQQAATQAPVLVGPKVGRNEPCTCGSGKKYKRCCGKPS